MMVSVVGTAAANAVIAVYFALQLNGHNVQAIAWLPMAAIMAIMVTYTLGILSLLTVIPAELFPKHLRGIVGALMYTLLALGGLLMVLVYEVVQQRLGNAYLFGGFAVATAAYVPFVWYLVPETRRRPLSDIASVIQARHASVNGR